MAISPLARNKSRNLLIYLKKAQKAQKSQKAQKAQFMLSRPESARKAACSLAKLATGVQKKEGALVQNPAV